MNDSKVRLVTAGELDRAHQAGRTAYANGWKRAPGIDRVVQETLAGAPVGSIAMDIFTAWLRGFDAAADEAAGHVLAEGRELTFDEAEAVGLDGTGRDGHEGFPHRWNALTDGQRAVLIAFGATATTPPPAGWGDLNKG